MVETLRPIVFALVVLVAAVPAALPPALTPVPASALIAAGRALGAALLVAVALGVAALAGPVPIGLIAFAGFLPLLRGLRKLLSVGFRAQPPPAPTPAARPVLAVAGQTITGGADALALLVSLFALHTAAEIAPVAAGVVPATAALALWRPPAAARAVRLVPAALVLIGAYLLIAGGAFNWLLPR
jgi:hypothetical protein